MRMPETPGGAAVVGAFFGAVSGVALVLFRDRYSFGKDWFLIVLTTVTCTSAWYSAARFHLSWYSIASVGLLGASLGGWLGWTFIGSYEYTVPTPQSEREMTIIWSGGQKTLPVPGVAAETVKRVPVGGAAGILIGWFIALIALIVSPLLRRDHRTTETVE